MEDINSGWIPIGDQMFERVELYANQLDKAFERFVPAPFGGPILIAHETIMNVHAASGAEISKWKWRTAGKIMVIGWSLDQDLVFVMEDGTVLVYSIFGELIKSTSMGQEAKDVKIRDAKIFHSKYSTGVAILTTKNRFFVVQNLREPRVRRFFDAEFSQEGSEPPSWPWCVLALERHARIYCMASKDLTIVTLSEVITVPMDENCFAARCMSISPDSNNLTILFNQGTLWVGKIDANGVSKIFQITIDSSDVSEITWCGSDTILAFAPDASQCFIINSVGVQHQDFLFGFVCAIPEVDSARVYSLSSQELIRKLPPNLVKIFEFGSIRPAAKLRLATEEFLGKKSFFHIYLSIIVYFYSTDYLLSFLKLEATEQMKS